MPIPLRKLPGTDMLRVLESMTMLELSLLSECSQFMFKSVQSLRTPTELVQVLLEQHQLTVDFSVNNILKDQMVMNFGGRNDNIHLEHLAGQWCRGLLTTREVERRYLEVTLRVIVSGAIQRLMNLFKIKQLHFFSISCHTLNPESLKTACGSLHSIGLGAKTTNENSIHILRSFEDVHWVFSTNPYVTPNANIGEKLFQQNLVELATTRRVVVSFEQLITSNIVCLWIRNHTLTSKQLNRFIRLWINGATPRMEQLYILTDQRALFNREAVFRRLNGQDLPRFHRVKTFTNHPLDPRDVDGGYHVYSRDRKRKMTIVLNVTRWGETYTDLTVWND